MALKLMYITNEPEVALIAERNGVDRIWIDLETLGKEERQRGMNTVKSKHSIRDIEKIKPLLTTSELLVRINPWNKDSVQEIDEVIEAGADILMLPMWRNPKEVSNFLATVNGRCKTILLLETKEAVACLEEVLERGGMTEIYIGLNDLHLSYGLTFMFELLSNGTVDSLCEKIYEAGIPYGFGGIACIGKGELPAEMIVMEHYRLGSTRVILSRGFCARDQFMDLNEFEKGFSENISKLREYEREITQDDFERNRQAVLSVVKGIVRKKKDESCVL